MIPEQTKKTIDDYVEKGWRPGHFVSAVLANDLIGAFCSADWINKPKIEDIVHYVNMYTPIECHGSYDVIERWIAYKNKEESNE